MKILMVNKFLYPNGGSETYLFKTGAELERLGNEVQYFGMEHPGRIVSNHAQSYTSNMDFHTGKLQKLLYPFKIIYSIEARTKIRAVLDDFKPDIVHLNNFNFQITPSVIYEIRKYGKKTGKYIPIIYTAHDYQWICPNHMLYIPSEGRLCTACTQGKFSHCAKNRCIHSSFIKSFLGTMEGTIYKWLGTYSLVDKIICPSEFMAKMLSQNSLLRDKTIVMHNFIFNLPEEDIKMEKEDYVLYFGRYAKEKGIKTLLKVCSALPEIQFVFAGSGSLEEEVNNCPNVINKGFLSGDELVHTIMKARVVLFPSEWYENCPFSVMEAQTYGTPVIATKLGGTPELLREEQTGLLVEPQNEGELADAIINLLKDEEKLSRFEKNCRSPVFKTLEEYVRKLLVLYRKCIQSNEKEFGNEK